MINIKNLNKIIKLISDYLDTCIKCGSTNISMEDSSEIVTCHNCSFQFLEEEQMDKIYIIAFLNSANEKYAAQELEKLSIEEFNNFIDEYVKEDSK